MGSDQATDAPSQVSELRKKSNQSRRSGNDERKTQASVILAIREDRRHSPNPEIARHMRRFGFFAADLNSPSSSYFRLERTKKHQGSLKTDFPGISFSSRVGLTGPQAQIPCDVSCEFDCLV